MNWNKFTLGEISEDISYGYTESASFDKVGPKFLRITDIQNDHISWDSVPFCPISEKDYVKYKLDLGDIVIARTGNSTGATACIKSEINAVYASYLIRYRLNTSIAYPFYIDFVLRSQRWKDFVNAIKGGSAQPGANAKQFAEFEILLPPLKEQQAIASILSSLDDKIELNLQMNKTLEEMAMTLYKEWFVDFGPFKDGNFVESELGLIPEGWEVKSLKTISYNKKEVLRAKNIEGEIKYIGLEHMDKGSISINNFGFGADVTSDKFQFNTGDLLFGKLRTYFKKVGVAPFNGICSTDILVVKPKEDIYFGVVLGQLIQDKFIDYVSNTSSGTRMPRASWQIIEKYQITLPKDVKLIKSFNELINSISNQIISNISENHTIKLTRDTLLPKLISGEIRVKDIEKEIAEVL